MQPFTIYKRFHRSAGAIPQGAKIAETRNFENLDAVMAWGDKINENTGDQAYHITGAWGANGDFVMFDMSVVTDQIPGYGSILWLDDREGSDLAAA